MAVLLLVSLLKQGNQLVAVLMNTIIQLLINFPPPGANSCFKAEVILLEVTDAQHLKQCWNSSRYLTPVSIKLLFFFLNLQLNWEPLVKISCYTGYKASQQMDSRKGHRAYRKQLRKTSLSFRVNKFLDLKHLF